MSPKQSGTILVLVLAVLALLSLLATTMASVQSLSKQEASRYIEQVEAQMLARMGVERAIAELKRDPFFGFTNSSEEHSTALNISGFASKGTYMEGGNNYSLKVSDLQGRIYINDGVYGYGGNNSSVSQNLKRILNALVSHPDVLGEEAPKQLGEKLIDSRPPMGYRNIYEILRVLQKEFGERRAIEIFEKLEPHITTFAWVDDNVANPVPLSKEVYDEYPVLYYRRADYQDLDVSPAVRIKLPEKPFANMDELPDEFKSNIVTFRRGRGKNAKNEYIFDREPLEWFNPTKILDDEHNAIYGLDELFPQYIEIVKRAPVNVNTASEPVVTALLTDISGFFVMERRRFAPYSPSPKDFSITTTAKFQDNEFTHTATIPQKYETWEYSSHTYDSGGYSLDTGNQLTDIKVDGDAFGYLYRTQPLKGSGNRQTGINDPRSTPYAVDIARHIVAAREGREYQGINYADLPFARFDKWSNMHRFFDYLVEKEIIKERRNIFWNYLYPGWQNSSTGDWSQEGIMSYPASLDDKSQQEFASYAIADALKANFNPNLHLNEANPDHNLWLRVDKTDLITNSTEFCFTPMGYFHIESLGRILKPARDDNSRVVSNSSHESTNLQIYNSTNSHNSTNLRLYESTNSHDSTGKDVFNTPVVEVSSSKVKAIVKVFDVYRETSQAQFLRGTISDKQGPEPTNSGKGLEIGPAPWSSIVRRSRSGTSPDEAGVYDSRSTFNDPRSTFNDLEYDGYIQLATLGGINSQSEIRNIESTPPGVAHWPTQDIAQYEGLHVHFTWDFKTHHHASAIMLGDQYRNHVSDLTMTSDGIVGKVDPALLDPVALDIIGKTEDGNPISDRYMKNRQYRYNLSSHQKVERAMNYSDDLKEDPGPYSPQYGHKMARSFRLSNSRSVYNSRSEYSRAVDQQNKSTNLQIYNSTNPRLYESTNLLSFAPSDLRLDGAYVERNAGLAYWIDEGISMFSYAGTVSMWLKPSFFPEHTGKTRKIFSYDRWHKSNYSYRNPNMFSLLFVPAHDAPPYEQSSTEQSTPQYIGERRTNMENKPTEIEAGGKGISGLRPSSLFGGIYMHQAGGSLEDWEYDSWTNREKEWDGNRVHTIDFELFYNTPTLNHNLHPDGKSTKTGTKNLLGKNNQLEAHKWTHIVWSWNIKYDTEIVLIDNNDENERDYEQSDKGRLDDGKGDSGGGEGSDKKSGGGETEEGENGGESETVGGDTEENSGGNSNTGLNSGGSTGGDGGEGESPVPGSDEAGEPSLKALGGGVNYYKFVPVNSHEHKMKIFINSMEQNPGAKLPETSHSLYMQGNRRPTFSIHSFEDENSFLHGAKGFGSGYWRTNTIRLGETSYHGFPMTYNETSGNSPDNYVWPRNFSGDFTIDEFSIHGSSKESNTARSSELQLIENTLANSYHYGRYYAPRYSNIIPTDCSFTSGQINLGGNKRKAVKILGAKWTWYSEDYMEENMDPIIYNYENNTVNPDIDPQELQSQVTIDLLKSTKGIMTQSVGGSKTLSGTHLVVNPQQESLQYKVNLVVKRQNAQKITLLSTPILDDVTIFYSAGIRELFYINTDHVN